MALHILAFLAGHALHICAGLHKLPQIFGGAFASGIRMPEFAGAHPPQFADAGARLRLPVDYRVSRLRRRGRQFHAKRGAPSELALDCQAAAVSGHD
jgi:hypothetical protein